MITRATFSLLMEIYVLTDVLTQNSFFLYTTTLHTIQVKLWYRLTQCSYISQEAQARLCGSLQHTVKMGLQFWHKLLSRSDAEV